ncbi:MAG: orotate phosphoribosyltransferase [Flavobacteriaceae bacterium]|jgi:orotate phosphoribosyltransferase|nr:orotate phosphoribosyltransferase [Flavobacteriaceae bacterium]|tara:strand:+ start:1715 stop:2356 length:642 start_codon:yes stop_codon:yes gene_type:complete
MVKDEFIAKETAKLLLQINAIKLNPKNPFTWASGWKSPIYCDNRIILSYPKIRKLICDFLASLIDQNIKDYDLIAGVATGAIGVGMLVANKLDKPFIYVRSDRKKHGRKNNIEGFYKKDQKVVVIEDLISTGKSSLDACDSLISENLKIKSLVSIFNYNFDISEENFKSKKIEYFSLCSYNYLIDYALENNFFSSSEIDELRKWRNDPINWNR